MRDCGPQARGRQPYLRARRRSPIGPIPGRGEPEKHGAAPGPMRAPSSRRAGCGAHRRQPFERYDDLHAEGLCQIDDVRAEGAQAPSTARHPARAPVWGLAPFTRLADLDRPGHLVLAPVGWVEANRRPVRLEVVELLRVKAREPSRGVGEATPRGTRPPRRRSSPRNKRRSSRALWGGRRQCPCERLHPNHPVTSWGRWQQPCTTPQRATRTRSSGSRRCAPRTSSRACSPVHAHLGEGSHLFDRLHRVECAAVP